MLGAFFGVYLFGTNKSCFLFFFAECERFVRSQKRGQKLVVFFWAKPKTQSKNIATIGTIVTINFMVAINHSFLIASAGEMRVTKYDGPTSIRIDATARPILISNHAGNDSCTGTWST